MSVVDSTARRAAPGSALRQDVWRYFADEDFRVAGAEQLFSRLAVEAPLVGFDGFWVVSDWAGVRALSHSPQVRMPNPAFPAAAVERAPEFVRMFRDTLSFQDRADHHRLRGVLGPVFSPAAVRDLRTGIDEITRQLLARAFTAGPDQALDPRPFEFVDAVADRLPVLVTGALLGIPENEWDWLQERAHSLLALLQNSFPAAGNHHGRSITSVEFDELLGRIGQLIDGTPDTPLAGAVAAAVRDGTISRDEAVKLVMLLFMTGVDTVTAALTNTVHQILDRPRLGGLLDDSVPAADLFAEATRLLTPSAFAPREVLQPLTFGGVQFRPGDAVMLCFAAANRDPARFQDPGAWNPGRRPSGNLSFGHGAHHCIGAALAGIQAESVLAALRELRIRRDPALPTRWRREITFRGPAALHLLATPVVPRICGAA